MKHVQQKSIQALASSYGFITALVLIIAATTLIECDRPTGSRRLTSGEADSHGFKSKCGDSSQVSQMIGKCAVPMFELMEGRFSSPRNDDDVMVHCNKLNTTERCIRQVSKDCLTGLHKTSLSAVAAATKRLRLTECKNVETRARLMDPLKCMIKRGKEMETRYKNYTAMLQAIRDLPDLEPEEKMMKCCCVMNEVDKALEQNYNRECPASTPIIVNIVNVVAEDARNTLCKGAKCENALNKVISSQLKQKQNFIEPIMQILFMLNVN